MPLLHPIEHLNLVAIDFNVGFLAFSRLRRAGP